MARCVALEEIQHILPADEEADSATTLPFFQSAAHLSWRKKSAGVATLCCAAALVGWVGLPGLRGQRSREAGITELFEESQGSGAEQAGTGYSQTDAVVQQRRGSFLVLGDWGWDEKVHGSNLYSGKQRCQRLIAEKMLETYEELGDVKFVINVGDSFYPNGVKSKDDPQWDTKWRNVYDAKLRSVPWYSVYGNHDLIEDPCACAKDSKDCALVNNNTEDLNYFYMPDVNFNKEHPELDVEIVALDTNQYEWAWNRNAAMNTRCPLDCAWTKCQAQCEWNMKYRARDAELLLKDRYKKSPHKNLLVFSHYPTDYFWNRSQTDLLDILSDSSLHHVEYFAGHRHSTDQTSTISTAPNNNWLVGGGGGWSCDSPNQGFVVGEIDGNGDINTYSVLVPHWECCDKPGPPTPPGPSGWKPPTCKTPPYAHLQDI
eukprot:TRINITY_DN14312_c0_g1_i1.p1 TRINITY_DN14312_c0_g1~~TRINITY_DN14312_c0_g1_i1.p1  ORF type:complete len:430 (+),score=72.45 TRINITY_DN14312_c0_g1_i1:56-1345(+)